MKNQTEILVVDDEPQIRRLLRTGLASYDYEIVLAGNGQTALETVAKQQPDIVVLDINLGTGPDGLDVCRILREWSATPIIMLTVNSDKKMKLAALNAGADDYITKPFDMEELEARIRAVLRRSTVLRGDAELSEIRVHDLVLDLVKRRVTLKGEDVHLTPTEYRLLRALATHPGKVMAFQTLLDEIAQASASPRSEHYVRVYINTLREKLHDDAASAARPRYIHSEPGIGYRFTDLP